MNRIAPNIEREELQSQSQTGLDLICTGEYETRTDGQTDLQMNSNYFLSQISLKVFGEPQNASGEAFPNDSRMHIRKYIDQIDGLAVCLYAVGRDDSETEAYSSASRRHAEVTSNLQSRVVEGQVDDCRVSGSQAKVVDTVSREGACPNESGELAEVGLVHLGLGGLVLSCALIRIGLGR